MRERDVERYLVLVCEARGGVAWKWVSPGRRGVPDRIVVLPPAEGTATPRIFFVELKAPGESPTPQQRRVHGLLKRLGAVVYVVDGPEAIDALFGMLSR